MRLRSLTSKEKRTGFTLVELLVVMAILVILAGISTNGIMVQQKKSRDARRKADLELIRGALERYRSENQTTPGKYPTIADNNVSSLKANAGAYLDRPWPEDPKSGQQYQIEITESTYNLQAAMEYDDAISAACPFTTLTCVGAAQNTCNYCVTQP